MRLLIAALLALAMPAAAQPLVIRARTFDGTRWLEGVTDVVVDGSRIVAIRAAGSGDAIDIPGAVLTPGLVDLDSMLGLSGRRDEPQEAFSPDLFVADSFAPDDAEARALRASGVTTAWLAAGEQGVLGGHGALVQPSEAMPRVVARQHGECASLATPARQYDRFPSSAPVAADALLSRLSPDALIPARIRFDDEASARLASQAAATVHGIAVGLPSDGSATGVAEAPRVILSGNWVSVTPASLSACSSLVNAGVAGIGSGNSVMGPAALRLAAHRLVESGAEPVAVLAALTGLAGRFTGRGIGRLEPQAAADLVLWSGDPTSLASRPLIAWVGGQEIHRAP